MIYSLFKNLINTNMNKKRDLTYRVSVMATSVVPGNAAVVRVFLLGLGPRLGREGRESGKEETGSQATRCYHFHLNLFLMNQELVACHFRDQLFFLTKWGAPPLTAPIFKIILTEAPTPAIIIHFGVFWDSSSESQRSHRIIVKY